MMLRTRLEVPITATNETIVSCISDIDKKCKPINPEDTLEVMLNLGLAVAKRTHLSIEGNYYFRTFENNIGIETKALYFPIRFPWEYTAQEIKTACSNPEFDKQVENNLSKIATKEHCSIPIYSPLSDILEFLQGKNLQNFKKKG